MNNKIITILLVAVLGLFSCSGNHSARGGEDSAKYKYNQTPNADTSKITTKTGDASNIDNSASGGTRIDTMKKDSVKK